MVPSLHRQEPGHLDFVLPTTGVAGPGWERTGLCSCDLAGGSASLGWAASRAVTSRKCVQCGQVLGRCRPPLPLKHPAQHCTCPPHSWPTAPCSPRVSLGPLTIRAHSSGQLRPAGGVRGAPWLTAGPGSFPARSLQKAPAWSAPLPPLSNHGLRRGWRRTGAASCRGRDKSWGTLQWAQGRPGLSYQGVPGAGSKGQGRPHPS